MRKAILLAFASVIITHAQTICVVGRTLCPGNVSSPIAAYTTVEVSGVATTQWSTLNLIPGSNMTLSCVSNNGLMRTDCTFTSTGGGGGGSNLFSALLTSTNTTAHMTCGAGCNMDTSGSGVISATNINGGLFSGTSGNLVKFGGLNTPADSGIAASTVVEVTFPGTGVAHFATSGQVVTPSLIVNADIADGTINLAAKVTGILPLVHGGITSSSDVISYFSGTCNSSKFLMGAGACVSLSGDVSNAVGVVTILAVNGVTYSSTATANGVPVVTAPNTTTYRAVPTCGDASHALGFNASTFVFSCQAITASAGSVALDTILAAGGANTIASGDNAQVWNWALTTASKNAFTFGETTAASGPVGSIVVIQTLNTSTASPLTITAGGTANGVRVDNSGSLTKLGTGSVNADHYNGAAIITVTSGGTGTSAFTAHGVLLGESTSPIVATAAGAADTVFMGAGSADPTFVAVNNCGDATHALSYNTSTHAWGCQAITGSAPAGGSNTQLQYNNSSALGGVADFTWNGTHTLSSSPSGILDLHSAATSGFLLPGGLATGILKVTTSTGAVSSATIATCGDATHATAFDGINFTCQAITGSASAGGSNTQIQYNNSGALGGTADLTYNSGTHVFTMSASSTLTLAAGTTTSFLLSSSYTSGVLAVVGGSGQVNSLVVPGNVLSGSSFLVDTTTAQTLTNKSISASEVNSGILGTSFGGTGANLSSPPGIIRAGNPFTSSELSGDALTSGSNVVTVLGVQGIHFAALATGILKNTTGTGTVSIAVAGDFPTLNQNTTGTAASITGLLIGANFPTLTLNAPVIGGGAGNLPTVGARSGNTTTFATTTGALTATHVAVFDASGNIIDGGAISTGNFGAQGDFSTVANGTTPSFTPGWSFTSGLMMVFLNGVKQQGAGGDFYKCTGTNAPVTGCASNNILFNNTPLNGDIVEVIQ